MPRGSIAFVVGSLFHGAGKNMSGKDRVALTINYCNGRMHQQENLMLSIRPEKMLSFSKPLQDILGCKRCFGTGHIMAQDPRSQIQSHYGPVMKNDPYRQLRNQTHAKRLEQRLTTA